MYLGTERNGRSRSSKVVDLGTNRKRICNLLFVIDSNVGHILPSFRAVARSLLKTATPLHSVRILGVLVGLDWRYWGSEERIHLANYSLITFEVTQLI